jgi:hypothetical protein
MASNKKIKWGEELKTAGRVLVAGIGKFFKALVNVIITILLICALTGIIVVSAFTVYINNYIETEIDADQFRMNIPTSTTTHIYRFEFTDRANREGVLVPMDSDADYRIQGEADQIFVPYEQIPDNMINAIIAIEDKRFMTNSGVDWKRTIAAGANFFLGFDESGYGGSSITQQLIKNVTQNDDYSIQRKIQEIFWALDLETKMDKEEILELYLNIVNFGNGCNGVQAAGNGGESTIRPDANLLFVAGAGWTKKQADGAMHLADAASAITTFLSKSGASLGSSKSLVDMPEAAEALSFMSHMNQVGQTGSTPRHAKGLSTCCHGEEPHVVGWRFINERRAINLDANCGWAQGKADVVYVADAFEVMKKVNELM